MTLDSIRNSCDVFGQVMSPHNSDQISQRSKVSRVALGECSPKSIVIVIDIVMLLVRSCLLIALIICLKGHKFLRVLYGSVFQQCGVGREGVTRSPIELFWTANKFR